MIPPETMHPDAVRAELAAAEKRARAKRRKWILIGFGAGGVAVVALAVAIVLLFQATGQIKKQGKTIVAQGKTISAQTKTIAAATDAIVSLQQAQVAGSATGRTTQLQVATLVQQIAGFTDPNSPQALERAKATGQILAQLASANQAALSDQLRKLGELAVALGVPQATVSKILAEPVPVPTFAVTPAKSAPAKSATSPSPSPSPALNVQVQCPIVCPPK